MQKLFGTLVPLILLVSSAPAIAEVMPFTGTVTGVSSLIGPDPTCAPLTFRSAINPASTVGYSSIGNFTLATSTCLSPGGGASFGTFTIDFGAGSFSGTFDGGSTPSATPGISDTAWLFTVLGGTGSFAGASGTIEAAGLADARTRPTHVAIAFIGSVIQPVPEPASWGLMVLGFGALGLTVRRGRRRILGQVA